MPQKPFMYGNTVVDPEKMVKQMKTNRGRMPTKGGSIFDIFTKKKKKKKRNHAKR